MFWLFYSPALLTPLFALKDRNYAFLYAFPIMAIWMLLSLFRPYYGNDLIGYFEFFSGERFFSFSEVIYPLLLVSESKTINAHIFFAYCFAGSALGYWICAKKLNIDYLKFFLLYCVGFLVVREFASTRAGAMAPFLFLTVFEKKRSRKLIYYFLASSFHFAAFFMAPIALLVNSFLYKKSSRTIALGAFMGVSTICSLVAFPSLLEFLIYKVRHYSTLGHLTDGLNLIFVLAMFKKVGFIVLLFLLLQHKDYPYQRFLFFTLFLSFLLPLLGRLSGHNGVERLGSVLDVSELFLLLLAMKCTSGASQLILGFVGLVYFCPTPFLIWLNYSGNY